MEEFDDNDLPSDLFLHEHVNPSFARVGATRHSTKRSIVKRVLVRITRIIGGMLETFNIEDPPHEYKSQLFLIYEFDPVPTCYFTLFPSKEGSQELKMTLKEDLVHYETIKKKGMCLRLTNFTVDLEFEHIVHRDFFLKSIDSVKDPDGNRFKISSRKYRRTHLLIPDFQGETIKNLQKSGDGGGLIGGISSLSGGVSAEEDVCDIIPSNLEYSDWSQEQILFWMKHVLIQPYIDNLKSNNQYEIISLHRYLSLSKKLVKIMIYLRNRNLAMLLHDILEKLKQMKKNKKKTFQQEEEEEEYRNDLFDSLDFLDEPYVLLLLRNEISFLKWNGKHFSLEYYNVLTKKIQRMILVHKVTPDIGRIQCQLIKRGLGLWNREYCTNEILFILLNDLSIDDFIWKLEKKFFKKLFSDPEEEESEGENENENNNDNDNTIDLGDGITIGKGEEEFLWREIDQKGWTIETYNKAMKEVQKLSEVRDYGKNNISLPQISFPVYRMDCQAKIWKQVEIQQKKIKELGDQINKQKETLEKKKKIILTQSERLKNFEENIKNEKNDLKIIEENIIKKKKDDDKKEEKKINFPVAVSAKKKMKVILESIVKRTKDEVERISDRIQLLKKQRLELPKIIEEYMDEFRSLRFDQATQFEYIEFLMSETRQKAIHRYIELGLQRLEISNKPIDTNVKLILSISRNRMNIENNKEENKEDNVNNNNIKKKKQQNVIGTEQKILRGAAKLFKGVLKDREWFKFGFVHVAVLIRSIKIDWFSNGFVHFQKLDLKNNFDNNKRDLFFEIFAVDAMCPHYGTTTMMMRRKIGLLADVIVHYNSSVIYEDWHIKNSKQRKNCQEFSMEILRALESSQFFPEVRTWFREVKDMVIKHMHSKDSRWIEELMFIPKSRIPSFLKKTIRTLSISKQQEIIFKQKKKEQEEEEEEEKKKKKKKKKKMMIKKESILLREKYVFKNHEDLDEVVLTCRKNDCDFELKYPGVNQLLKSFCRAFWIRKMKEESSSINSVCSDSTKPIFSGCPYGKPFRDGKKKKNVEGEK